MPPTTRLLYPLAAPRSERCTYAGSVADVHARLDGYELTFGPFSGHGCDEILPLDEAGEDIGFATLSDASNAMHAAFEGLVKLEFLLACGRVRGES